MFEYSSMCLGLLDILNDFTSVKIMTLETAKPEAKQTGEILNCSDINNVHGQTFLFPKTKRRIFYCFTNQSLDHLNFLIFWTLTYELLNKHYICTFIDLKLLLKNKQEIWTLKLRSSILEGKMFCSLICAMKFIFPMKSSRVGNNLNNSDWQWLFL